MKVGRVLGALAVAVLAVAALAPAASAQTALAAPNCQHGSTYGQLVKAASLGSYGTIQLCRDSGYNYWGFVLFNNPLTASQWGQAVIERHRDGFFYDSVDCDSPGGNGYVEPGQTRCWTPKFTGLSGRWTFVAEGRLTSSHTGAVIAWNRTVVAR